MHRLNFCTSLCLPKEIEGYKVRGINAIYEFEEAFVVPMARPHTPFHILYASRPITLDGKILKFEDLDTKEKVDEVSESAIAPDSSVDPDKRYDPLAKNRDKNIAYIAEALLREGFKEVVIWSNNGIGNETQIESENEGIIRGEDNIVFACKLDGKVYKEHNRNLKSTYQKIAHDHTHIAPDTIGFGRKIAKELDRMHYSKIVGKYDRFRKTVQIDATFLPCISICIIDKHTDLSNLKHTFHPSRNSIFPKNIDPAGFAKNIVQKVSKERLGIDFTQKEVYQEQTKRTIELYNRILK